MICLSLRLSFGLFGFSFHFIFERSGFYSGCREANSRARSHHINEYFHRLSVYNGELCDFIVSVCLPWRKFHYKRYRYIDIYYSHCTILHNPHPCKSLALQNLYPDEKDVRKLSENTMQSRVDSLCL